MCTDGTTAYSCSQQALAKAEAARKESADSMAGILEQLKVRSGCGDRVSCSHLTRARCDVLRGTCAHFTNIRPDHSG